MSNRINVRTEDGELVGWFSRDAAAEYHEDTYWDGNNHISLATGSQWVHEVLLHTAGGRWVLARWSQWQGSGPARYEYVGDAEAGCWLLSQHEDEAYEMHFGPLPSECELAVA